MGSTASPAITAGARRLLDRERRNHHPVSEMTVAGNLKDMSAHGRRNDLEFRVGADRRPCASTTDRRGGVKQLWPVCLPLLRAEVELSDQRRAAHRGASPRLLPVHRDCLAETLADPDRSVAAIGSAAQGCFEVC